MSEPVTGPTSAQGPISPPPASGGPLSEYQAWKQWLGPTATDADVRQLFTNMCNQINHEIQKQQAKAHAASEKLKKALIGEEDDS